MIWRTTAGKQKSRIKTSQFKKQENENNKNKSTMMLSNEEKHSHAQQGCFS